MLLMVILDKYAGNTVSVSGPVILDHTSFTSTNSLPHLLTLTTSFTLHKACKQLWTAAEYIYATPVDRPTYDTSLDGKPTRNCANNKGPYRWIATTNHGPRAL